MSSDLAARLRALAERHPVAADAAELEAIAAGLTAARGAGGRAKAAAHGAACQRSREAALGIAKAARRADPDVSQAELARSIRATLGAQVPDVEAMRGVIRAWERSGQLPLPPGRLLTAVHPKPRGACHTGGEQDRRCPEPPEPRSNPPQPPSR